ASGAGAGDRGAGPRRPRQYLGGGGARGGSLRLGQDHGESRAVAWLAAHRALPPCAAPWLRKSLEWMPCFFSSICRCERFMSKRLASSATVPPTSCNPRSRNARSASSLAARLASLSEVAVDASTTAAAPPPLATSAGADGLGR